MSSQYNAKQDLLDNFDKYKDSYDLNINYINEHGGIDLSNEEKHILIAGFLLNMHETLSTVSSNLCSLSKSTYDAQTYISEIQKHQEQIIEGYIKSDLNDILNDEDMDTNEKLYAIQEYVDSLKE